MLDRRRRRARLSVVLALASLGVGVHAAVAATPAHHDAPDAPPHTHAGQVADGLVGTLDDGTPAAFWATPEFVCDGDPDPLGISAPATCDDGLVFTWTVEVTASAPELWVDWDKPFRQDDVRLTVTSPSGEAFSQESANSYSGGIQAPEPELGTWTVELEPIRTDGMVARMRAALVDEPTLPEGAMLPNLRVTPPFEFGFVAPASPLNPMFLAGDDQNPPLTIAGNTLTSCAVDEVQEASDPTRQDEPVLLTRCLRFTSGPHNVGEGHFDLRFPIVDRALADQDRLEEMTQIIHHADGTTTERAAGTYEYHVTHGHYHYLDILFYEAYEVVDATAGELRAVGVGHKSGFCPADQGYGEWTSFDQGPGGAVGRVHDGDNCFATSGNGAMGLSAGWGDFYRWQRSGQYVDFSDAGDGHYVIRATVDVLGNVLETDDTDNTSYAYLCIEGDEVTVFERGYGMDPWDPAKVVATDNRAAQTCEVEVAAAGEPEPAATEDSAPEPAADDASAAPAPQPEEEQAAATEELPATGARDQALLAGLLLGASLLLRRASRDPQA